MFRGLVCKVFVLMKMVVMVAVIHEESEISVLVCVMRSWRALDFVYTSFELQTRIWTNFSQVGGEL